MSEKKVINVFLHPKPSKILISLKKGPKYATLIAKEVDCTYSHVVKLLDYFSKLGLIKHEKKGRTKIIELTDAGKELATHLENVLSKLSKLKG